MEQRKPSRRRSRRPKVENFYKILGVRANATQETIKKKYIESVKAFPPESHPEEFQRIRRAYETLRDPVKRSEYDLLRKYGGQIEKIMEEALEFMEVEQWEKAAELLRRAVKISPNDFKVRLPLAHVSLLQGDEQSFQEQFQIALELVPEDQKIMVLALKAKLLLEEDRAEEAFEVLENARALYPEQSQLFQGIYVQVYQVLGREEELWSLTQSMLPAPESQTAEDIYVFINYINTLIELEKWSVWSNVQARMRKFLKSISDEEDKLMVLAALKNEHDEYYEVGRFREAEMFIDLAYYIDSKNPLIQRKRRETQDMMRIEKEIKRMNHDQNLFPLVSMYAFEWFFEDFFPPELLYALRESLLPSILNELQGMDEVLAEGIVYLRKKYPLVYRRFQERWDALFNERVGHLNREARRRLR